MVGQRQKKSVQNQRQENKTVGVKTQGDAALSALPHPRITAIKRKSRCTSISQIDFSRSFALGSLYSPGVAHSSSEKSTSLNRDVMCNITRPLKFI